MARFKVELILEVAADLQPAADVQEDIKWILENDEYSGFRVIKIEVKEAQNEQD